MSKHGGDTSPPGFTPLLIVDFADWDNYSCIMVNTWYTCSLNPKCALLFNQSVSHFLTLYYTVTVLASDLVHDVNLAVYNKFNRSFQFILLIFMDYVISHLAKP